VAIFGLGGIGMNIIQGAGVAGAERIIGIDLNLRSRGNWVPQISSPPAKMRAFPRSWPR
jgi:Zn-dependent alcohol dehydrogenase